MVLRFTYRTVAMVSQVRMGIKAAMHWLSCQGDSTSPVIERHGRMVNVKTVRRGLSFKLDSGTTVTWCMSNSEADLVLQLSGLTHKTSMDRVDIDDAMFMASLNRKGLALLYRVCVVFPRWAWWNAACEHQHGMFAVGLLQETV